MPVAESGMARFPWVTLALVVAGTAATVVPDAGELLQYDRDAVEAGAWWRVISGQLAHWTPRMAGADLLVVSFAGGWLESRSRRLFSWTLGTSAILVGLTVHLWSSRISVYRGSSGIATALFVAAALEFVPSLPRRALRLSVIAGLVLLGAKIAWEVTGGEALFAGELPAGVSVVPAAHLAGALSGIVCVVLSATLAVDNH